MGAVDFGSFPSYKEVRSTRIIWDNERKLIANETHEGKEVRRSLRTTDRPLARRNPAALKERLRQTDWSQSRLTLGGLCERFSKTIQH